MLLEGDVGPGFQGNVCTHAALADCEGPKQHSGLLRCPMGQVTLGDPTIPWCFPKEGTWWGLCAAGT